MKKNVLIVLILLLFSQTSFAWSWRDLWSRPDEQAAKLLKQGKADMAVKLFQDPKWRAVARYRSGSYQQAAIDFGQQNSATGFYNQGNALARSGQYQQAIAAYDKALKLQPEHQDALYNKAIIEKLLQDKQQQDQSEKSQKQKTQQEQSQSNNQQNQGSNKQDQKQEQKQQSNNQQQEKQNQPQSTNDNQQNQQSQQNKQQNQPQQSNKQDAPQQQQQQQQAKQQPEKPDADEQMLNRIPDDPGGLLRQKFLRDHYRRKQGRAS